MFAVNDDAVEGAEEGDDRGVWPIDGPDIASAFGRLLFSSEASSAVPEYA